MGFTEILTIIFVLLKAFGVVSWSWWIVFLPEIIAVALYILVLGIAGRFMHKTKKSIKKSFDDDFFNL